MLTGDSAIFSWAIDEWNQYYLAMIRSVGGMFQGVLPIDPETKVAELQHWERIDNTE